MVKRSRSSINRRRRSRYKRHKSHVLKYRTSWYHKKNPCPPGYHRRGGKGRCVSISASRHKRRTSSIRKRRRSRYRRNKSHVLGYRRSWYYKKNPCRAGYHRPGGKGRCVPV